MFQPNYGAQRSGYASSGQYIGSYNRPPHEYYRRDTRYSKRPRTSTSYRNTNTTYANTVHTPTEQFSIPFTKKSEYIAIAPAIYIKGKSHAERRQFLDQTFGFLDGYTGSSMRSLNSASYYAIFFNNDKDRQSATQVELTFSYYDNTPSTKQIIKSGEPNQSNSNQNTDTNIDTSNKIQGTYIFTTIEQIQPPVSDEQRDEIKARTIQVIDIPLNVTAPTIRTVFNKYGTIEKLNMKTVKMYQH